MADDPEAQPLSGGPEMPIRSASGAAENRVSLDDDRVVPVGPHLSKTLLLTFDSDEIEQIRRYTAINERALTAFIHNAICNHLFIRSALSDGGEFILKKRDGRFHRVSFF